MSLDFQIIGTVALAVAHPLGGFGQNKALRLMLFAEGSKAQQ